MAHLGMSSIPVDWLDRENWRLPSGKLLAEFALQSGFLAPLAFRGERFGTENIEKPSESITSEVRRNLGQQRNKQFDKGEVR